MFFRLTCEIQMTLDLFWWGALKENKGELCLFSLKH